jgi:hypothetical protein
LDLRVGDWVGHTLPFTPGPMIPGRSNYSFTSDPEALENLFPSKKILW